MQILSHLWCDLDVRIYQLEDHRNFLDVQSTSDVRNFHSKVCHIHMLKVMLLEELIKIN